VIGKLMLVWCCDVMLTCIVGFPCYQMCAATSSDNGPSPTAVTAVTR
jgi:hypothetical protein